MPSRLLLLTGPEEAAALAPILTRHNPSCRVVPVATLDSLHQVGDLVGEKIRLFAFCTAVIVPPAILGRMEAGAYNIHPGPPEYPGRLPACWGSYDGVRRFGATLHKMAPRVDEGAIVAVESFAVEHSTSGVALSDQAFRAAIDLFLRFAAALVAEPKLPVDPALVWRGRKTRLGDYETMRRSLDDPRTMDLDPVELRRRRRAFDLPSEVAIADG